MEKIESYGSFGGVQEIWGHDSDTLNCSMQFAVYLPPQAQTRPCPVLYWLSGLTCTERNMIEKAGAQRYAAELGMILVCPDTSPRGEAVADDPAYDLGQGAGFYLNATQAPWAAHYRMYDYVVEELPALIAHHFPTNGQQSIFGHSMGGHGALVIALKNPIRYQSVSAFAPIVAPSEVPWGEKAFTAYLGEDRAQWAEWDATALLTKGRFPKSILIDQGLADAFLENQLQPERFEKACKARNYPVQVNRRAGYDHSYYFIASFIGEHMEYHARALAGRL